MAGVDFNTAIQAAIAEMAASTKDINIAAYRAGHRTMQFLRTAVSRSMAAQLGIPVGKLKGRVRYIPSNAKRPEWRLFVGLNDMPYDIAGKVYQNAVGLSHKGGVVKGGFYSNPHGKAGGWIRKKRAKDLGLKLPGLDKNTKAKSAKEKHRFPVLRISHDLGIAADPVMMVFEKQANAKFLERFNHELRRLKGSK